MSGRQHAMRAGLDLADIQGNIVRPYGRFGFPITRHLFFNIGEADAGRRFVETIRHRVTTSQRWGAVDGVADPHLVQRPEICVNVGFSFAGLLALALPTRTLSAMPEEFIDGMAKRCSILGDVADTGNEMKLWDPIWCDARHVPGKQIHVWVSLNAPANPDGTPVDALETQTQWLIQAARDTGNVACLDGHRGPSATYQESAAIMQTLADGTIVPTAREHFGFTDGIGDPTFAGQYEAEQQTLESLGGGKIGDDGTGWAPLATGEFILGHASEAQELPTAPPPWSFTRNGTFMVYRKLHQNIASFDTYIAEQANLLHRIGATEDATEAAETIKAKMVGRWANGLPLAVAPTYRAMLCLAAQWHAIPMLMVKREKTAAEQKRLAEYDVMLSNFRYSGDGDGAKCPAAAHIRRANPRDSLDPHFATKDAKPTSALVNRRRIMRRGAPYGGTQAPRDDCSEHGVIFMAICASLFRQFEFIQQQWIQYGASFDVGNDTDPLVGLRRPGAKFIIPADPAGPAAPFICAAVPSFVGTRGGEYFFLPSLTALRQIAQGTIDPT